MARVRTVVALAAALFGLVACGDESATSAVPDVASFEVSQRDLRVTISEKATLKAKNQILIRPQIPGQAKILSLIDEGSQVAEGDVLAELDSTDLEKEIEDLRNRIIKLQGEVKAAEADLSIQLSQNEADIEDSKRKLRFAKIELERYIEGEFVQEKTKRETRVQEAESTLERAQRKYDQMPALLEEGFVTTEQVEEERINLVKATSDLALARLDIHTYLTYTKPKDEAQKQADVRNAELEADRTVQRCAAREAQKVANLEQQKSELGNVTSRLEEQTAVLDNMVVRAPGPGIVIYGNASKPWDEREIAVGENVYAKQAFLTLPNLSEMQAVLAVHEADIARVEAGQKCFISVETVRGQTLDGSVSRVALVPQSQNRRWGDNIKRFEVEVSLDGDLSALELKPGLTARVEILVEEMKGVTAVPSQAVFAERGKYWVFLQGATGFKRREVQIKPGNTQFVVITEGLSPGDRIALYNPERAAESSGGPAMPSGGESDNGNGKP